MCCKCSFKSTGIKWGAGIINSWAFDSIMQPILLNLEENPGLRKLILSTKYDNADINKALANCLDEGLNQNWSKVHKEWPC